MPFDDLAHADGRSGEFRVVLRLTTPRPAQLRRVVTEYLPPRPAQQEHR